MKDPILDVASPAKWEQWLKKNHDKSTGVLLRIAKKGQPKNLTYAEALDVALCWGWIDSVKLSLDETAFLQRFSPRRATSPWSKINVAKIEVLVAAGRMQPQGQAHVDAAKADGRWERAYSGAKSAELPADLAAALKKAGPKAVKFFDGLNSTNRYAILFRLMTAKKPETRAARLEKFVAMCQRGEKIY